MLNAWNENIKYFEEFQINFLFFLCLWLKTLFLGSWCNHNYFDSAFYKSFKFSWVYFVWCEKRRSENFVNEILRSNEDSIVTRVTSNVTRKQKLKTSPILTFDSTRSFKEFAVNIIKCNVIGHRKWSRWIFHRQLQLPHQRKRKLIDLATAYMFTNTSCSQKQFKVINRLRSDTQS